MSSGAWPVDLALLVNEDPVFSEDLPAIPGYEAISALGHGSGGMVFLAEQIRLGRKVAIKRLGAVGVGRNVLARRFRREARTLAALDHPNIVRVYDFIDDPSGLYLVMEYVDGPTLRQVQGRLSRAMGLGCIRQLTSAVDYANGRWVIHRDIKPENVLVTPSGNYKLADFGIAKVIAESLRGSSLAPATQAGDVMGTAAYISPEAAAGKLDVGPEADVYSLGILSYELLVGRLPFEEASTWAALVAHATEPPPRPSVLRPGFPHGVEAVLMAALEKEPSRRPRPASQFWQRLDAAATEAWPAWADEADLRPAVPTGGVAHSVAPLRELTATSVPSPSDDDARRTVIVADEGSGGNPGAQVPIVGPVPQRPVATPAFRPGRHRYRRIARAALTVALAVAVAVTFLLKGRSPTAGALAVTSVSVSAASPTTGHCPQAVFDFRGEIKTNGGAGDLVFTWSRPDGSDGPTQTRSLPAGTNVDVETLQFTFSGAGATSGAAAMHVIGPANVYSAPIPVRYQCP